MKIDLAEDFAVTLKCGCRVTFIGSRGHKVTEFRAACDIKGLSPEEEPDPKKRLANYDRHANACRAKAKRIRATMMEEIDMEEASEIDTTQPPE